MKKKLISTLVAFTVACTFTFGTTAQAFAFTDADRGNFDAAVKVAVDKADETVTNSLFAGDENYALLTDEEKAQAVAAGKAFYKNAVENDSNAYWNTNFNKDVWEESDKNTVEAYAPATQDIKAAMIKDVMPAAVANAQKALKTKVEGVDSADYVDSEAIDNAKDAAKVVYEAEGTTLTAVDKASKAFDEAMQGKQTVADKEAADAAAAKAAFEKAVKDAKDKVTNVTDAYKNTAPLGQEDEYAANATKAADYINAKIDAAKTAAEVEAITVEEAKIAALTTDNIASLVEKINKIDTLKKDVATKADAMKAKQQMDGEAFTGVTEYRAETIDKAVEDINTKIESLEIIDTEGIDAALANVKTRAEEDQDAANQALADAKTAAKKELSEIKYDKADQEAVTEAIAAGEEAIEEAEDADAVTEAKDAAITKIEKINTLRAAKEEAKKALATDLTLYDKDDQATVTAAIAGGEEAIEAAEDAVAVTGAKDAAIANIEKIKTTAQKAAEEKAKKELADAKTAAKKELSEIKYDEADQEAVTAAIEAGKEAIDGASDADAVTEAKDAAIAKIEKINTLRAAKEEAKKALATDLTLYDEDDQATVTAAIEGGEEAIEAAQNAEAVTGAKDAAIANIEKIKTTAQKAAAKKAMQDAKAETEKTIEDAVSGAYSESKKDTYFAALDAYKEYLAKADQEYYEAIETSGNVDILKAYTANFITKAKAAAEAKVNAIPSDENIKLDSVEAAEKAIEDAKAAIEAYDAEYKDYTGYGYSAIDPTAKINAANARIEIVKKEIEVVALINAIPEEVTIKAKDAVEKADAAYKALGDNNTDIDTATKAKLDAANKALAKSAEEFALEVAQEIANLDVTNKEAVVQARADYNALTEAGKAKVATALLQKLEAAENAIAEAEAAPVIEAINKATADINADSRADVEAAKAAYDALDAAAQAAVAAKIANPDTVLANALATVAAKEAEKIEADIVALGDKAVTADTYTAIAKEVAAIETRIAELKDATVSKDATDKLEAVKAKVAAKKATISKAKGCTSTISLSTKGLKKSVKMTTKVSSSNKSNKTGFKIYSYNTKTKKYSLVKTVKTSNTSATYKKTKLTKGKNYYYAVKTYKVIDGKTFYGKMSKKVSVKVK